MLDLDACGEVAEAGAKARRLARARAMGLPVPPGVVVLPGEEIDAGVLAGWLRRLGPGPFVVRSSAQQEDREGRSAAGLLLSRTGVAAAEVPGAEAAVRASGQGEAVRRYLGPRRRWRRWCSRRSG